MKTAKLACCSFVLVALLSFGCASPRSFQVDAIAAKAPVTARTYHIVPANPNVPDNDLRFLEAASILEKALSNRGYSRTAGTDSAALIITMQTYIGQPETVPVARAPQPISPDIGFYHAVAVPVRTRTGKVCYMRSMVWEPGDMVWDNGVSTTTIYEKRLSVTAFENSGAKDLPQAWSILVVERSAGSDIRAILPMMAVAAARYVEADTKGQVTVRLGNEDPEVIRIAPEKAFEK